MRLNKLELNGFKSFANKTEIVFGSGITAVIKENPVFFLAVCRSKPQYLGSVLGGGIFGALFMELFVVMDYYRRKAGLKNNIWTLKGSARFLTRKEVKQMVLHYAETE